MSPQSALLRPFEALAGREYPDVAQFDSYGDDLAAEQTRISMRVAFALDVVRLRGARSLLEKVAGAPIPDFDRIALDLERQNVGTWEHQQLACNEYDSARRGWVRSLLHADGRRKPHERII